MTYWPLVHSMSTVRLRCYLLNFLRDGFSYFLSFITDISLIVIHLKRRVPLWPLIIHPFIKPLIGQIVAIMNPWYDIVQLEFAFHEKVVFAFAINTATINQRKRFKCVLDYWIDVWLWCVRRILFDLVWLSFWFVVFCLGKVAYHRFVLLRFGNTLLFVCFWAYLLFIILFICFLFTCLLNSILYFILHFILIKHFKSINLLFVVSDT